VDFRLTYEGVLSPTSQRNTRAKHKHEIRKVFHPQLKRLWAEHPVLRNKKTDGPGIDEPELRVDVLARRFQLGAYNFVPLVTQDFDIHCNIDVLLLRPEPPGGLIGAGDLDNRIKTLFDAFRRPTNMGEVGPYDEPEENERPFYCLLEDDVLVTKISVQGDMLLEAIDGRYDKNMARLVISVSLRPYVATWTNIGL